MSPSPFETNPLADIPNPFERAIVSDPWDESSADVADINQAAFEKSLNLIARVRRHGSTSLILSGEPGSGKTHLLARLRRHLDAQMGPRCESLIDSAVFIAVRLHTTPALLWKHLRREMAISLLRPRPQGAPLLRCVLSGVSGSRIEQLQNLNLATALCAYRDAKHVMQASAWLRGEGLPQAALDALSLMPEESEEAEQSTAWIVVQQLCHLIHPVPVVFCLDQVEAIQAHPDDVNSLPELARAVTELHDGTNNVLIVSCIQTSFLHYMRDQVRGAFADRWLNQNQAGLQRLTWDQSRALMEARLDSQPALRALRQSHAPLWPLNPEQLRAVLEHGVVPARKLLHRARELFEHAQGNPPPPAIPLDEMLAGRVEEYRRGAEAGTDSSQWDRALADGLPLVLYLAGAPPETGKLPPWLGMKWSRGDAPSGIVFCNQANSNALFNKLKKVREGWQPSSMPRLYLLRDSRLNISPKATATMNTIGELERRGAVWLRPTPEAVAALDALRRLLSEARSGDLSHNGETVAASAVETWMRSHQPPALAAFVDLLLGAAAPEPDPPTDILETLADYLARECVASAADASAHIGVAEGDLIAVARNHASRFGLLEGPPAVLFGIGGPGA